MKIGLVTSLNINTVYPTMGKVNVPLGLLCIAAVLEPAGYEVEIVDPNLRVVSGELKPEAGFEDEIARRIYEKNFDAVGFSSLSSSYQYTLRTACSLRKLNPNIPIFLGGPQATHTDVATLEAFDEIDAVVRGEGEMVVLDLLSAFAGDMPIEDVQGITYRKGGKVHRNEDAPLIADINELPLAAYKLYPVKGKANVTVDAGRGCPYRCNFCSTCVFWRRRFRQKLPKRIVDEMEVLKYGFGARSVDFTHDLFTLDRKKTVEFCKEVRRRKLKMPWSCSTRVDAVDKELLKMMAKAGCMSVFYGVESGSPRMQKIIGKEFDVSLVKPTIRDTADAGIEPVVSFIIGFPEETEDDLAQTVEMVGELLSSSTRVRTVQIHLLAVTNETKLWDEHKDKLLYDGIQSDQSSGWLYLEKDQMIVKYPNLFPGHYYVETPHMSREFLKDLHILGFAVNSTFRWSFAYASKKTGSTFRVAKSWHKWRTEIKTPMITDRDFPEFKDPFLRLLAERIVSFAKYLKMDPDNMGWNDGVFQTLFEYETFSSNLKGNLIKDETARQRLKYDDILEIKEYPYDPGAIIGSLTSEGKKQKEVGPSRVKIEYIYKGWTALGPLVHTRPVGTKKGKTKRRRHDTVGKRRNTRGNSGRRVSSLPRGKLHRKNKGGAGRRRTKR